VTERPKIRVDDPAAFEALLRDSLAGEGRPAPFEIDVAARVMARVAEIGPAPRSELGARQWAAWAAAAAAAGVAILSGAASQAPTLAEVVQGLGRTTSTSAAAASTLGAGLTSTAAALGHALVSLAGAAAVVLSPLARLQPVAAIGISAVTAGMLLISSFVVGRDLRARAVPEE
jgi:hypothetical protein